MCRSEKGNFKVFKFFEIKGNIGEAVEQEDILIFLLLELLFVAFYSIKFTVPW